MILILSLYNNGNNEIIQSIPFFFQNYVHHADFVFVTANICLQYLLSLLLVRTKINQGHLVLIESRQFWIFPNTPEITPFVGNISLIGLLQTLNCSVLRYASYYKYFFLDLYMTVIWPLIEEFLTFWSSIWGYGFTSSAVAYFFWEPSPFLGIPWISLPIF